MSNVSKTTLKTYFVTGATPTEAQFGNLIDSSINVIDDVTSSLSSDSSLTVLSSAGAKNLKDALDAVDVRVVTLENAETTFSADYYNKTEVDSKLLNIGTTIDGLPYASQISALDTKVASNESSLAGKSDTGHSHAISDVNDLQASLDNKVTSAELSATRTDLTTAINSKVSAGHTHVMADITDLADLDLSVYARLTDLDGKASSSHQHLVADVTDIGSVYYNRTEVDSKIAEVSGSHTHVEADITNLDKYTQGQTNLKILDHASLVNNPHAVTKAQVSLGNVENLSPSSLFSSSASTSYKSGIMGEVQSLVDEQKVSLGSHASLTNNPHAVSKAQVGLGSVPDIDVKALLDAHTSSTNPHNIDLSFFDVYTKAETENKITLGIDSMRYEFKPNSPSEPAGSIGDLTWKQSGDSYKAYLKVAETAWQALALFEEGADGNIEFNDAVEFKENVTAEKNLTIKGDLTTESKSTLGNVEHGGSQIKSILNDLVLLSQQGKVQINDTAEVTGDFNVDGKVSLASSLSVLGEVSLGSNLHIDESLEVDKNLTVTGKDIALGDININNSSISTSSGDLNFTSENGVVIVDDILKITGRVSLGSTLYVSSNSVFDGTIDVEKCAEISNLSICNSTIATTDDSLLGLPQNVKVTGQLETTGLAKIGGNLEVMGNLTVQGTQTILNTTTLDVEDNIVKLNKNVTGTPNANAGLEVERGSQINSKIYWDETADLWKVDGAGTVKTIAFDEELDTLRINNNSEFGNVRVSIGAFNTSLNTLITTHSNKTDNPHSVTKAQVGLGNCDNTSDVNKPVSTAQGTAIGLKVNQSAYDIKMASLGELITNLQTAVSNIVSDKYSAADGA